MDHQKIRTLRVLEEIDNNQFLSQRYLSQKLDISLGLVNSFLKRLAQKGYFKAKAVSKNRMRYILTPQGVLEKTNLSYEYFLHSLRFYRDARKKIRILFKELDKQEIHRLVFCGVSDLTEIAYLSLQETALELKAVLDAEGAGRHFFRMKVQGMEDIHRLSFDRIFITAMGGSGRSSLEKLLDEGIDRKRIIVFSELG